MSSIPNFRELLIDLLSVTEKIERYRHHAVTISTYLYLKCVPKGFLLKAHNNIVEVDLNPSLRKCSIKNMVKTLNFYKRETMKLLDKLESITNNITKHYQQQFDLAIENKTNRENNLRTLFTNRRKEKFARDALDVEDSDRFSRTCLQCLIDGNPIPTRTEMVKMELLSAVEIPPHEPLNLDRLERDLPAGLSNLCKKGPSFVPTPDSFDWLQLEKDFDRFRNRIRASVFFFDKSSTPAARTSDVTGIQPPKTPSSWNAPKAKLPEVETFLSNVERDLFATTKRRKVEDNLSLEERAALKTWRQEHLFNPQSDLVIRQQDKGNRFVVVDKETDIKKSEEQIQRSSFQIMPDNPTQQHIDLVKNGLINDTNQNTSALLGWTT